MMYVIAVTNKEIMSSPLITIETDSNSSPSVAAHIMLQTNVKHLLVVDKSNVNKPILDDLRYAVLYTDEELKDAIEKLSEAGPANSARACPSLTITQDCRKLYRPYALC
jgi:CBS domain-containing protein